MFAQSRGRKMLLIGFFSAISLFFAYFIVLIAMGKVDQRYSRKLPAIKKPAIESRLPGKLVLEKDQQRTFGKLKLTYRGLNSGSIILDVVLVELDPEYAYRHCIPQDTAAQGIRFAGAKFNVLSAGRNKLYLAGNQR
jgi:hypothetical protein